MFKKQQSKLSIRRQQSGFAAFAVTLIMIIVISLIVLGFATNAGNEQRRALDAQLSSAAYYAAESGVNDAYAIIKADDNAGIAPQPQTNCTTGPYADPANSTLSANPSGAPSGVVGNIGYTCLLVNPQPPSLEYIPLDTGHGQVVPVFGRQGATSTTAVAVQSITISWQEDGLPSSGAAFTGCPATAGIFPARSSWSPNNTCTAGMLQVDIAPAAGWTSQAQLQSDTKTVFLEPSQSGANSGPVSNGAVIGTKCTASGVAGQYACTETLTNLPASPAASLDPSGGWYYLHITPIYLNADVLITAYSGSTPSSTNQLNLYDAQALIDSTGKASDELQRIQERVSINPVGDNDVPVNALQSKNGICKKFTARPAVINVVTPC